MACIRIEHGFLCGPDDFVNMEPFGAHVWMSWHHYLGPTFYRSEAMIKPILVPSKKTWDAFGKWRESKELNSVSSQPVVI
jgi:hypothetical protein